MLFAGQDRQQQTDLAYSHGRKLNTLSLVGWKWSIRLSEAYPGPARRIPRQSLQILPHKDKHMFPVGFYMSPLYGMDSSFQNIRPNLKWMWHTEFYKLINSSS